MHCQSHKVTLPARCHGMDITVLATIVRTGNKANPVSVILAELAENKGPSVTNAFEFIANSLRHVFPVELGRVPPERILWFEYYCGRLSYCPAHDEGHTVDLVSLSWDACRSRYHSPEWRRVTEDDPRDCSRGTVAIACSVDRLPG